MSLTDTSRYISLLLRHKPQVAGLTLDPHGWVAVDALIAAVNKTHPLTRETLEEIVRADEKGRYSFSEDGTRIRANQGHSVPVDVGLAKKTPPALLYHGTSEGSLTAIEREGLLPRSRLYVHLSVDAHTAARVGARHGKPTVLVVDATKMTTDGYDFYVSENGVWLTKAVPPRYLSRLDEK